MRLLLYALALSALFAQTADAQDARRGEDLFKRKCKGCHRLTDGVKMGPGLAGVTTRRSDEWLHRWLEHPGAMIEAGDPDAVRMKQKYKKTMRRIKAMADEKNRNDIIAFLKENDAKR